MQCSLNGHHELVQPGRVSLVRVLVGVDLHYCTCITLLNVNHLHLQKIFSINNKTSIYKTFKLDGSFESDLYC